MDTEELDFIQLMDGTDRWIVYAKNSNFGLGHVVWSDDKHAYDYLPNSNGKLMKITQRELSRNELTRFCKERTAEKEELGGNK